MGHPILRRLAQSLHVSVLSRQPDFAQRRRVAGAQTRIAAHTPLAAGRGKPCLGLFTDQGALELGRCAQNLQGELALWGRSVDRVLQGAEKGALASSRSMTSRRCDSDRARRSIRTTTSVSPLPIRSITRARTGRARLPPEACSSWISVQPADFSSCTWGRGV